MKNSLLVVSAIGTLFAHQPVMDMAPRWSGGWGFQFPVSYTHLTLPTILLV